MREIDCMIGEYLLELFASEFKLVILFSFCVVIVFVVVVCAVQT